MEDLVLAWVMGTLKRNMHVNPNDNFVMSQEV
jgi:hypothetical protein